MIGTIVVNLRDLIDAGKDEEIDDIRSEFSCPYNKDVENFIKEKAVLFSKQGIATTYLVLKQYRGEDAVVGYFSIAQKYFHIDLKKNSLSNTQRKRINKFSSYDEDLRRYIVSALLIGQLAKNYANGYDRLIEGDKLLRIACDKVMQIQRISSGRFVYLECEDKPRLLEFYERNGF
ncbi:N-acetyltransferase [Selenomonas sp. F0473]|uniref:N-acetyltransferase n=1 Tax=Selenomonas sp. F0473 TaxID=999423 RepID=UPI0025F429F9|nr:N-acetyltransferase [Selenomonas sp. F0473]